MKSESTYVTVAMKPSSPILPANTVKPVYSIIIDDDDDEKNPTLKETNPTLNSPPKETAESNIDVITMSAESNIDVITTSGSGNVPVGIPNGLPSYFEWTDVIRCTLHKLSGPSTLPSLTVLEQKLADNIMGYIPIEIDYTPQRPRGRGGRGGGGKQVKEKNPEGKQAGRKKKKSSVSERMNQELQPMWDKIFKTPEEKVSHKRKKEEDTREKKVSNKRTKEDQKDKIVKTPERKVMCRKRKKEKDPKEKNPRKRHPLLATRGRNQRYNSFSVKEENKDEKKQCSSTTEGMNQPNNNFTEQNKAGDKQYSSATGGMNQANKSTEQNKVGKNHYSSATERMNQANKSTKKNKVGEKQYSPATERINQAKQNKVGEKQYLPATERIKQANKSTEQNKVGEKQHSPPTERMNQANKFTELNKAGEKQCTSAIGGMGQPNNKPKEKQCSAATERMARPNKLTEQKAGEKQSSSTTESMINQPKKSTSVDQMVIRLAMSQGLALRAEYAKQQRKTPLMSSKQPTPHAVSCKQRQHQHISSRTNFFNSPSAYHSAVATSRRPYDAGDTNSRLKFKSSFDSATTSVRRPPIVPAIAGAKPRRTSPHLQVKSSLDASGAVNTGYSLNRLNCKERPKSKALGVKVDPFKKTNKGFGSTNSLEPIDTRMILNSERQDKLTANRFYSSETQNNRIRISGNNYSSRLVSNTGSKPVPLKLTAGANNIPNKPNLIIMNSKNLVPVHSILQMPQSQKIYR